MVVVKAIARLVKQRLLARKGAPLPAPAPPLDSWQQLEHAREQAAHVFACRDELRHMLREHQRTIQYYDQMARKGLKLGLEEYARQNLQLRALHELLAEIAAAQLEAAEEAVEAVTDYVQEREERLGPRPKTPAPLPPEPDSDDEPAPA
jgi:uncharacterized protein with von Willebrand factor type A (vWA) domain